MTAHLYQYGPLVTRVECKQPDNVSTPIIDVTADTSNKKRKKWRMNGESGHGPVSKKQTNKRTAIRAADSVRTGGQDFQS
jgi:hypothetical protein